MVKPTFKATIDLTPDTDAKPATPPARLPPQLPPPLARQLAAVTSEGTSSAESISFELPPEPKKPDLGACPASAACTAGVPVSYSDEPYDPLCLFQALFGSFLAGAVVGGVLVYAFSSTEYVEIE